MRLTRQQRAVLREMLAGCCRAAIAARLGIAEGTVHFHQMEIYRRLGINSHAGVMAALMTPKPEARALMEG